MKKMRMKMKMKKILILCKQLICKKCQEASINYDDYNQQNVAKISYNNTTMRFFWISAKSMDVAFNEIYLFYC